MSQKGVCPLCHHPMRLHKAVRLECTRCACGEELIAVDDLMAGNLWHELGLVVVIALVMGGGILLGIRLMEGWLVPW